MDQPPLSHGFICSRYQIVHVVLGRGYCRTSSQLFSQQLALWEGGDTGRFLWKFPPMLPAVSAAPSKWKVWQFCVDIFVKYPKNMSNWEFLITEHTFYRTGNSVSRSNVYLGNYGWAMFTDASYRWSLFHYSLQIVTVNSQHIPMHVYSELNPTVFNGVYPQISVYRIASLK